MASQTGTGAAPGAQKTSGKNGGSTLSDAGTVASAAGARANEVFQEVAGEVMTSLDLQGRVDRNPYGTLAAALGVGFVLGGGLFSRLTARLLGAGLRMGLVAALPAVQKHLWEAAMGHLDRPVNVTPSADQQAAGDDEPR